MNRKFSTTFGILLLLNLCTFFLSTQPIFLMSLYIVLALAKHTMYPIKKEFLWFVLICTFGPIVEIILVNFSHAWTYTHPQFFGIPIWIPFYWGVMGTTFISLYEGFTLK